MTEPQYTYQPEDMVVVLMEGGRSEAHWTPSPKWGNPVGNVHGGYVGVLVDDVAGMAIFSLAGGSAPTVTLQVDYLHQMPVGLTYRAVGEIVRAGKATAIVDVHVYDPDEQLVARGKCYFQMPSAWRDQKEREQKERTR